MLDPFTGQPASFCAPSRSPVPDLAIADAYATAAVALNGSGLDRLATLDGYERAAGTERGDVFRSDGLLSVSIAADGEPPSPLSG